VTDYRRGQPVFVAENHNKRTFLSQRRQRRRGKQQQAPSKNFLGARWMISIKPVYKSLSSLVVVSSSSSASASASLSSFGGTPTNDAAVLQFVVDVVHAGALMHAHGILHRDLKPQHILLSAVGRPVLMDFGYAEYGRPLRIHDDDDVLVLVLGAAADDDDRATPKPRSHLQSCAVQPGQRKGEVEYVRADDLAQYRGCQRGDTYAMGKTFYELFLDGPHEHPRPETAAAATLSSVSFLEQAQTQNRLFWDLLYGTSNNNTKNNNDDKHHPIPRGRLETLLSDETSLFLVSLIQGLCRPNNPLSFEEAEQALRSYLSK